MDFPKTLAFGALGLAIAVFFHLQHQGQAKLRDEVETLRRSNDGVAALRSEGERLVTQGISPEELIVLRNANEELKRLDAELAALKKLPSPGSVRPTPKPLAPGMTSLLELKNVGAATPAEALQTFFWTVAEADPAAMARLLDYVGDARLRAEELFASLDPETRRHLGSPEEIFALYLQALYSRVSGVQLLRQDFPASGYAAWSFRLQTMSGKQSEQGFGLRNEGGSWRVLVTPQMVEMTRAYLGTKELRGQ